MAARGKEDLRLDFEPWLDAAQLQFSASPQKGADSRTSELLEGGFLLWILSFNNPSFP